MIVLDTNVISELMRPSPTRSVIQWIDARPSSSLYTTSIAQAEIFYGILLLPAGRRRSAIEAAARATFENEFEGRVLAFGPDAAEDYAKIAAKRRRAGRPIAHFDAQIAAIALAAGADLVTRNVADFEGVGVRVINPWERRP